MPDPRYPAVRLRVAVAFLATPVERPERIKGWTFCKQDEKRIAEEGRTLRSAW